ncbi:permease for cytosine/purines, uracil, thiamine, allantoin-domain-containing protein [Pholiota molesta]|nr:permease for cytosine/purines, uracil, thiamine, allantoin-domain-containing protein [Pholiota molesta]
MAPESSDYRDAASEKAELSDKGSTSLEENVVNPTEAEPSGAIVARFGVLGPLLAKLFDLGVEARGVERVPENMRDDTHFWNNIFMWWSVNTVLTTISIGVLAQPLFALSLPIAAATILCFGALATCLVSFIATLGPKTGLRTMIIARFSSGYVGGAIYSILNIITELGFSVLCVVLGGQALVAVNPGTLPLGGGIVIVGVLSLIPCFIGYDMIHKSERFAWIPLIIVMLCLWGLGAKAGFDVAGERARQDTGRSLSADVLSFGGIVFGSFSGWGPVAADYNCRMPANTSPWKIFGMTFIGLYVPICLIEILGAALASIDDPAYINAYTDGGTGGLVAQVLQPWHGGGKFLLVILALSNLMNNIINTYSAGLSIQALGRPFAMVPRFFWTLVCFAAYTIAGVVGRAHFSEILTNFLAILGYWTGWFAIVVFEEHFIFRRKGGRLGGYNFDDWDTPSKLPMGIAGILAGCFGVAGAVVGMAELWYIGPLGKMAGGLFGTDLGFELAAAFAAVTYPPLRWLEIYFIGR